MKKINHMRAFIAVLLLIIAIILLYFNFYLKIDVAVAWFVYAVSLLIFIIFAFYIENVRSYMTNDIELHLDSSVKEALEDAGVGLLVYDDNLVITWMSEYLLKHSINHIDEKLYDWLPEMQTLLNGEQDEILIIINDDKFAISKKRNANVIVFKNISTEYDLRQKFTEDAVVLGLINFDNYEEVSESEDDLAYINTVIRPAVYAYCRDHNLVYKSLRNNRIQLILNEKKFVELLEERFSILNIVKKEAKKGDIEMTLSMAFARGNDDLEELDKMASSLLEIAQTRGGDQVVVRKGEEEARFYGGNSEARGKRSKVRVRVIANTLKDLLNKASNVIICGHQDADADCLGSALCLSSIAANYTDDVAIITKSGGLETTVAEILKEYNDELGKRHNFISEDEAINRLNENTIVIMTDHHSAAQSNGSNLLKNADNIVIIDHHRRKADLDVKPILAYIEASASSACELCCEFVPYLAKDYIETVEANMMYLGMIIDTNRFRVRTGERTFEVASYLRQKGADPSLVEKWQKEPYENVKKVAEIIDHAQLVREHIVVAEIENGIISRSLISQACDRMMEMKGVYAGFVIAHITNTEMAISARSDGTINVQLIMEKMHGGGHLTSAGVQRNEGSISSLSEELKKAIDDYLKEEKDENNPIE